MPRDRLLDGFAGHEQKTDAVVAGLDDHFIAPIEQDQKPVRDLGESAVRAGYAHAIRRRLARLGPVTEAS